MYKYFQLFGAGFLVSSVLGCSTLSVAPDDETHAFIVLGEQGRPLARVLTSAANCPSLQVDGVAQAMHTRMPAASMPLRATVYPSLAKASNFPLQTCDLQLPAGSKQVLLNGKPLPLPAEKITKIVVIGDTGCRIAGKHIQNCNDAEVFPFAKIAQAAANWQPQLVVHVGDYHYRETPCPEGESTCVGSPWGYGWDSWKADFFQPAKSLLQAAPWVFVRGNHESCRRAGQGWWRLLDPRPLQAGRDCNDEKNDAIGNYAEPYAVPLGDDAQLLVVDSSAAPNQALSKDDPAFAKYSAQYITLEHLSNQASYNFAAFHHPLLGIYVSKQNDGQYQFHPGNQALQSVFSQHNLLMMPPRVQTLLAGHTHTWQQLSFSSGHASNFIAGNAGSALDPHILPAQLPADAKAAANAVIDQHNTFAGFGFMTMERDAATHWQVKVWDKDGKLVKQCEIENRASRCQASE